jgi:chromosomal replication initiation ATPase DnaA
MPVLNPCKSEETVNRSPEQELSSKHPLTILQKVCSAFGVSVEVIISQDRHRSIVRARFAAMWVFRELGIYSFPEIGRILVRDHTTIIPGVAKANVLRAKDKEFARLTDYVLERIKV